MAGQQEPPNVLIVTLDTTRADRLGCYGYPDALTPAIDSLAARGTLFEQAFTSCPLTLPAHASLFTGLLPPEHAVRVNGNARLDAGVETLAERLQARGYQTAAFVAAAVVQAKFGLAQGFDVYDDDLDGAVQQESPEPLAVYRPARLVVDRALGWLSRRTDDQPFLCWVHLYDAHTPDLAHAELEHTRHAGVASYDAELSYVDLQLGRLLSHLRERGLEDRTLVVVLSDHGEGLGDHGEREHGYLLTPEVLRVPLIVALPGVVQAGARVPAVVSLIDVAPTILELAGAGPSATAHGRSLVPALNGQSIPSRPSYAETDMPWVAYRWGALRSLTTPDWKYVRSVRPELYDRHDDAGERRNLAGAGAARVAELDAALAVLEQSLVPGATRPVTLTADERARLEALGYLDAGASGDAGAASAAVHDVKDMLGVKHLRMRLGRAIRAGRASHARVAFVAEKLVRASPETPQFRRLLGTTYLALGRSAEAAAQIEEAVRLEPSDAQGLNALADARMEQGRASEALELYTRATQLRPDLAEAHFGRGNGLVARGDLDEAVGAFGEALLARPAYPEAHLNIGNVYARRRQPKRAREHYLAALELKPDFALAHHALGTLLARNGRTDAARRELAKAISLQPGFAPAHFELARLLVSEGELSTGVDAYREAVRLDPNNVQYWDNLAAAYAASGQFDDAGDTARRAIEVARQTGQGPLVPDIEGRLAFYERSRRAPEGRPTP